MWNKDKSVILSSCITKAVYLVILVCCVAAPFIVRFYDDYVILPSGGRSLFMPLLITLYCIVPPAVFALINLDLLLWNIRKGKPFIQNNVRYLRRMSAVFIYFSFHRPVGFVIVFAAAFFGLILRVVKNCFEQAVAIREENDFTV